MEYVIKNDIEQTITSRPNNRTDNLSIADNSPVPPPQEVSGTCNNLLLYLVTDYQLVYKITF